MRNKFAIAIQLPRFATERGEDSLNREGNQAEESLLSAISRKLKDGDEAVAHCVRGLAQCLEEMADAANRDDDKTLSKWCDHATELVDEIEGRGNGDE